MIHKHAPLAFAALGLSFLALTPVVQAQEPELLNSREVKSLGGKARDWFEAELEYEAADNPRDLRRKGKSLSKAKANFMKEWESRSKKVDILASVPDVRAVFAGAFPYDRVSSSGELKRFTGEGDQLVPEHYAVSPRRYDEELAHRAVVVLGSRVAEGEGWSRPKEHFDATWETSELREGTIFALPELGEGFDFDRILQADQANSAEIEFLRNRAVLGSVRGISQTYHIDFDQVFLDAGRGSGAFALRFATYFPQFFAGLIIRDPVDVTGEIRLGSIRGMPVLLLTSDQRSKDAADALAKVLNGMQPDSCTVVEGKGDHPFAGSQPEIDKWMDGRKRNLTPHHVVLEPNHDSFNDAYWVLMGVAEPLNGLPDELRPRMEVKVDRENNRIEVDARSVEDFQLLLNDDLLDLSKEFTVVVNGKAFQEQRERSLRFMVERMVRRRDPGYVFTTEFAAAVPNTDGD